VSDVRAAWNGSNPKHLRFGERALRHVEHLPINFAAPLRATSIIDLWRRWHISLSRFLRDFVYVPLGARGGGQARRTANLFLTMVLGGLWHGANWTFVLWGAFPRRPAAINHAWRQWRGRRTPTQAGRFAGWCVTFTAFVIGMVLFPRRRSFCRPQHVSGDGWIWRRATRRSDECRVGRWGLRVGLISEDFVRTWLGANWSVVGTLWTAGALAIVPVWCPTPWS